MPEYDDDQPRGADASGKLLGRFSTRSRGGLRRGARDESVRQPESITCPHCGRKARLGWKHCIYCGKPLSACPSCGAPRQNVPGEAFCSECGASLGPPSDVPTVPLDPNRPPNSGTHDGD